VVVWTDNVILKYLPLNPSYLQNKWDGKTHWPCSM
jgi:hypothetical protein